ncbi:MAG: histidine phosphatase family protein [Lachnospiraceae bacterium]|nr:histidine phosphatase family protein [Lachnospiraceae bacterium]
MNITVIRHGKVDMRWPRWCNAEEFDNACLQYEEADILPVHAEKKAAAAGEPVVTGKIYVSTQHRSLKTAKALFGEQEYIQMSGLCEVPLRSFTKLGFRLPLWVWNMVGRLQWYFGSRRQTESRSDTVKRAKAAVRYLAEEKDCVVVTHGFFMKTFLRELEKAGYVLKGNRAFGFENLHMVRAEKRQNEGLS